MHETRRRSTMTSNVTSFDDFDRCGRLAMLDSRGAALEFIFYWRHENGQGIGGSNRVGVVRDNMAPPPGWEYVDVHAHRSDTFGCVEEHIHTPLDSGSS